MEQAIKELTEVLKELVKDSPSGLEIAALVISIIALVFSVYDIHSQKKMNQANLQAVYFTEIFGEYLKFKIPDAVKNLDFNAGGKLNKSYKSLIKVLFAMIRESGYFDFINPKFHANLKEEIQALEDFLIDLSNKTIVDKEDQLKILMQIRKKIGNIVNIINVAYENI